MRVAPAVRNALATMPMFDWECQACHHRFEEMASGDQKPACPACQATEVEKIMSLGSVNMYLGGRNIPRVVEAKPRVPKIYGGGGIKGS